MAETFVCTTCGAIGQVKRQTPGSILIELVLWIAFIVPGVIYSLWRMSARRRACAVCGSTAIVPANSPRGRQITEEYAEDEEEPNA